MGYASSYEVLLTRLGILMEASPTAMWENVFLLILTALVKILFTAWTFGMMVREAHKCGTLLNESRFPLEFSCLLLQLVHA
jgi:hypothetical protein